MGVLVRQYRCGFDGCSTAYANKRNNMERHVWTRHVRELLKFKPHVRYIANYHKIHVDKYVVMALVEEDEAHAAGASPSPASPMSQSMASSVARGSISEDDSAATPGNSSAASSGYAAAHARRPHYHQQQQQRQHQPQQYQRAFVQTGQRQHSAPSYPSNDFAARQFHTSESSEDEGFATPPHEVLLRMKYDYDRRASHSEDMSASRDSGKWPRVRQDYHQDRYDPYYASAGPSHAPRPQHIYSPSAHSYDGYEYHHSHGYAHTSERTPPMYASAPMGRPMSPRAQEVVGSGPSGVWRPW